MQTAPSNPQSPSVESDSPLRSKAQLLGLCGPAEWADEAIARGCFHYLQGRTPPSQRVSEEAFSNEELALVLLGTAHDPWHIRLGAMLLGTKTNDPKRIARLASAESCASAVRAIAEAAVRYEPDLPFWSTLLAELPPGSPPLGVMPHHSRYVSLPGLIAPRTQGKAVWLRPKKIRTLGYAD
jgi:hypothetical protein